MATLGVKVIIFLEMGAQSAVKAKFILLSLVLNYPVTGMRV